jgi:hypothetical protein
MIVDILQLRLYLDDWSKVLDQIHSNLLKGHLTQQQLKEIIIISSISRVKGHQNEWQVKIEAIEQEKSLNISIIIICLISMILIICLFLSYLFIHGSKNNNNQGVSSGIHSSMPFLVRCRLLYDVAHFVHSALGRQDYVLIEYHGGYYGAKENKLQNLISVFLFLRNRFLNFLFFPS